VLEGQMGDGGSSTFRRTGKVLIDRWSSARQLTAKDKSRILGDFHVFTLMMQHYRVMDRG
jgi:hypothetical protein